MAGDGRDAEYIYCVVASSSQRSVVEGTQLIVSHVKYNIYCISKFGIH